MAETVKLEVEIEIEQPSLCHGCLSQGRNTAPIPPGELSQIFFYLVPPQIYTGVAATKLCWECMAMLRKFIKFRNQLLHAQNTLATLYDNITLPSISNLKVTSKVNYDQSYEFEHKTDEDKKTEQNVDIQLIKKEEKPEPTIVDEVTNENTEEKKELKVEFDCDDTVLDSDTNATIEKHKPKTAKDKSNEKQKKRKKRQNFIKHAIVKTINTDWVDDTDCSNYFTEEYLDENEIDKHIVNKKRRNCKMKCKDCNKQFYAKAHYLRHRSLNHIKQPDSSNNCLLCKKKIQSLEELRLHWKHAHSCYFRCKMCYMYCTNKALMSHLNYFHTKLYCCDQCGEQLVSPPLFNKHYKKCHMTFTCDYCNKNFSFKTYLMKHILSTHSDIHKCEICHRVFPKHQNLVSHMTMHPELSQDQDKEAAYCVECDKQYPSVQRYKQHLGSSRKHKPATVKSIPCPECGKIYRKITYMRNHLYVTHMKEKAKHFCELCGKYFTNNWGLKVHYNNVHLKLPKPKNEICDICGRGFSLKRTLVNHRRTHTGERPYSCQFCSAAFAQKTALQTHQRTQHRDLVDTLQVKVHRN